MAVLDIKNVTKSFGMVTAVDSFELTVGDGELVCLLGPSGPVRLRRKSFDVLRYLLERSGRVVTREELSTAVWLDETPGWTPAPSSAPARWRLAPLVV